jgi:hypothetical protein
MEYTILRIIKSDDAYKLGDIAKVSPLLAQRLIDDGVAVRYKKITKDKT